MKKKGRILISILMNSRWSPGRGFGVSQNATQSFHVSQNATQTGTSRKPAGGSWRRTRLAFPAISLVVLVLLGSPAQAEIKLSFGIYTSDKPTEVIRQFKPVIRSLEAALSKKLDEPVSIKTQVAPNYEKGIESLVDGRVDFARFGPASYVLAKRKAPGIDILAMESNKGRKTFLGIICVPDDSPVTNVRELKGRTFAFGNERSTIGRYLSQHYLREQGISARDLKSYEYLDRHDKVGTAVGRKQFDAGALKENTFKKLVAKGIPIRSIASFPNVTKPWIARSGLAQGIREAIRAALLELKDPVAMKALKKDGFVEGSDDDYAVIREAIDTNNTFFE